MNETGATLDDVLTARREAGKAVVNVDQPMVKLVVFEICNEVFAFNATAIREILAETTVHFVPGCPESVEGVINLRGDIVSVISLATILGRAEAQDQARRPPQILAPRILIGHDGSICSGIRVDRVLDVADVAKAALQPLPTALSDSRSRLALAVLHYRDRVLTLLDLGRIFQDFARGHG
ncbi:CheW-like domain-containing protein [uncultured Gammaproteobacteria bacterium]